MKIDGIERIEGIEGFEGFEEFSKPEALRIHNPSTERGELELSAAKPKTRNPKLFKPFKPETLLTRNPSTECSELSAAKPKTRNSSNPSNPKLF
jgi:hypothetical protein